MPQPGKRDSKRLADMSGQPALYEPPSAEECDSEEVIPIEIDPTSQLVVRLRSLQGKIVDFSISQLVNDAGEWHDVARIDCHHGSIHRHQFTRGGNQTRQVIRHIPPGQEGHDVVNDGYTPAYELMFNEWEESLRRWGQ